MKYRAEIDGLRALAVVPVILFHAGFELFRGGFVGVDVFFVISGYLITTILIEDIENKRFSIVNFYERRARRILPALFFVMLVCVPFAWKWMLPSQMKDFSQSLIAVSLFASNILFWRKSGYFEAAAEEKPLLHTWSLAVEEQYYILFPIFLILAWRFGKNRVFWMIVVMAAISLLISEWGWRNQATANFYLAPTRAWELFAGSIAAFIVQKQGARKNNVLALVGLAAIIFSIFFYDETTPFPSVYTLVPVLGVVMLVLYANKSTFVAKLLSTKGFVGIGLISYSAYLWHQPLFAFARIRSFEHPSLLLMSLLSLTSLVLGYFSWRYVEKPFRSKQTFSNIQIFKASFLGLVVFLTFGYVGVFKEGFPLRFAPAIVSIENGVNDFNPNRWICQSSPKKIRFPNESCILGASNVAPSFALVGDSHSDSLAYVLSLEAEKEGLAFRHMWHNSCPPILGVRREKDRHFCLEYNDLVSQFITENDTIDTVVMSAWWSEYLSDTGAFVYDPSISNQVDAFARSQQVINRFVDTVKYYSRRNRKVIIVGQVPEMDINIPLQFPRILTIYSDYFDYTIERSYFDTRTTFWQEAVRSVEALNDENIRIVDPADFLCDSNICYGSMKGKSLYRDSHHLSNTGAQYLVDEIFKFLSRQTLKQVGTTDFK